MWCVMDLFLSDLFSMLIPDIKIISWNTQGAGNRVFLNNLKDMIRSHDPDILILLDTKISGTQATKVCECIGFDSVVRVEVVSFSGGIWVLWRWDWVSLEDVDTHGQVVTLMVGRLGYAASREELWKRLLKFGAENDLPWVLLGDFNETSSLEERTSVLDRLHRWCFRFNRWIDEMELLDMRFSGSKFTWNGGTDPATRTSARLDQGLCNLQWISLFLEASIRHLAANQSDHSPLLLSFNGIGDISTSKRPFSFPGSLDAPFGVPRFSGGQLGQ
ncbi:hypothetical protein V2J09_000206 [Rumex salicifolius]